MQRQQWVDIDGRGSTKVELTPLAQWRIVLLRSDLTPAFLVFGRSSTKVEWTPFRKCCIVLL